MKHIELAPFTGKSEGIGHSGSCDSVVLLLHKRYNNSESVIKWNRNRISSIDEARNIITFLNNSITLYKSVLGEEFIVPTEFVIGGKRDGEKNKLKIYSVQPFINGWDGKNIPEVLKNDNRITTQWKTLYSRLSNLYRIGKNVNESYMEQNNSSFPIELTVGSSRNFALSGKNCDVLPSTPNMLIGIEKLRIKLCDFGQYLPWNETMRPAYNEIFLRAKKAI